MTLFSMSTMCAACNFWQELHLNSAFMWPAYAKAEATAHLHKDNAAQCRGGKPG